MSALPVRSPVTLPVICPVTPSVPPMVVLFVTSRAPRSAVPAAVMLPLVELRVILSWLDPFCNIKVLDAPRRTMLSLNSEVLFCVIVPLKVELPSTFNVESRSTAPVTLRVSSMTEAPATSSVPSIVVLPEAPATINLLVLTIIDPDILALDVRLRVPTSAIPRVVVPVTPSVPPMRVLPDAPTTESVGALFGPM